VVTATIGGWTTLGLGGPAGRVVDATTEAELVCAVRGAPDPVLVLAGGSNVVVADAGFPGTVVRVLSAGITEEGDVLTVAAGEPWDRFVTRCVAEGRAGVECLAGIPGSVGATPIQNVGAYGQEVAETITAVRVLDRAAGEVRTLAPSDCAFAYRSSAFKRRPGRWVVLAVSYRLPHAGVSGSIRYAELARLLGVPVGAGAPPAAVRQAVLELRRGKGMVLDPADPDTHSAGSFFTNPILAVEGLPEGAPAWPEPDGRVKTSAAWLIEHAGFARGEGRPDGIAISSKHVLALTNRGDGTAEELVRFAAQIAARVHEEFGVSLVPEPVLVGLDWPLPS
jgi:UDP-N-acetylmuramate dehydrogenase